MSQQHLETPSFDNNLDRGRDFAKETQLQQQKQEQAEEEEEDFPFPVSISTTDFKNFNNDPGAIDQFLYKSHRFTSLDVLIKELKQLSSTLNQNLLDIVNHDYTDYIKLGKSINGGDDLINSVSEDLKQFKLQLRQYSDKFASMDQSIGAALELRKQLIELKSIAKLQLLLHDQIEDFEHLIKLKDPISLQNLQKITACYLSIINIDKHLSKLVVNGDVNNGGGDNNGSGGVLNGISENASGDENGNTNVNAIEKQNLFQQQYLDGKVASVVMEFKSFVHPLMTDIKRKRITEPDLVMQVLNIQKLIANE
ncbi:hypothetical protein KGF57_000642 [Candida theae]|uniref:Conserved oligomeric Golgi complex subunit 2 n=1 Tax=Candida theae TaxID=1198502 RepID=A0AAD5G0P3_9ASCO|nr:uncharacterized protein KGF57_000642 [Candida theae]KAI5966678.1 hypothetical protein KGF57_000642 [Candida theae]